MGLLSALCHYLAIFCNAGSKPDIAFSIHQPTRLSSSYLPATVQILQHVTDYMKPPVESTERPFSHQSPSGVHNYPLRNIVDTEMSKKEKLAVLQIVEGISQMSSKETFNISFIKNESGLSGLNQSYFYNRADVHYQATEGIKNLELLENSHIKGNNKSQNSNAANINNDFSIKAEKLINLLQTSLTNVIKYNLINSKNKTVNITDNNKKLSEALHKSEFIRDLFKIDDLVNILDKSYSGLKKELGNSNKVENITSLKYVYPSEIFSDYEKIDQLQNDTDFKDLIDSLDVNPNDKNDKEETDVDAMFDEFLLFIDRIQIALEEIKVIQNYKRVNKRDNSITVSNLINILNLLNSRRTLKLESINNDSHRIEMNNLIKTIEAIGNMTISDQMKIPVVIDGIKNNFRLSDIIEAMVKDGDEQVDNFSKVSSIGEGSIVIKTVRDGLLNFTEQEPTPYFLLTKLRNFLILEASVRGHQLLHGFSPDTLRSLSVSVYNNSLEQVTDCLVHMISRKDSVWKPAIVLASYIKDKLTSQNNVLSSTLADIEPLPYQ